ncbi:HEPN domain-containing protein [Paraburkholderia terrae]|uniref:HEPN domain-containing protein n=1 Tax=Paraburkholderia terrae TaxID=311230 RepID=UPI00206C0DFD|nr:MAE_28990/MAE_18760 family HEPN-like nuclease [Paraburkholderia terrae]BDC46144.1 hypothetical protein PTKU15_94410 [Paraburkholderia terrae]
MLDPNINSALDEIAFLRSDCLGLIDQTMTLCQPDANGDYPESFRVLTTPFLYAVWERCFTTSFGIMLKVLHYRCPTPGVMTSDQAAVWLQAEPFFASYTDRMKNTWSTKDSEEAASRKSIKASSYKALVDFIDELFQWRHASLSKLTDTTKLVMTFSNVNCAVLQANAEAIGLVSLPEFVNFHNAIGRLEDLVGRRNDIAHGTLARPPGNRTFKELLDLTREQLITQFCEIVQLWIAAI